MLSKQNLDVEHYATAIDMAGISADRIEGYVGELNDLQWNFVAAEVFSHWISGMEALYPRTDGISHYDFSQKYRECIRGYVEKRNWRNITDPEERKELNETFRKRREA